MSAGVVQIFPLEVDLRAAGVFGESFGEVKRIRPADVGFEQEVEFEMKLGIFPGFFVGGVELIESVHQGFRHKAPAENAEAALRIGNLFAGGFV